MTHPAVTQERLPDDLVQQIRHWQQRALLDPYLLATEEYRQFVWDHLWIFDDGRYSNHVSELMQTHPRLNK